MAGNTTTGPLVWMDMEMSGLDPDRDVILEAAVIITNQNLDIIATGPNLVVYHGEPLFETMDDWNKEHHVKSGLWDKVITSNVSLRGAEKQILDFLKEHTTKKTSPLCGNSIWQDRRFVCKYMPALDDFLHYRIIDVSSVKELVYRWMPDVEAFSGKKNAHRALDDIIESIDELKYYKGILFDNKK